MSVIKNALGIEELEEVVAVELPTEEVLDQQEAALHEAHADILEATEALETAMDVQDNLLEVSESLEAFCADVTAKLSRSSIGFAAATIRNELHRLDLDPKKYVRSFEEFEELSAPVQEAADEARSAETGQSEEAAKIIAAAGDGLVVGETAEVGAANGSADQAAAEAATAAATVADPVGDAVVVADATILNPASDNAEGAAAVDITGPAATAADEAGSAEPVTDEGVPIGELKDSLEGLKEFTGKVGKGIAAAVAKLIEKIKAFFANLFDSAKAQAGQLHALQAKLHASKEKTLSLKLNPLLGNKPTAITDAIADNLKAIHELRNFDIADAADVKYGLSGGHSVSSNGHGVTSVAHSGDSNKVDVAIAEAMAAVKVAIDVTDELRVLESAEKHLLEALSKGSLKPEDVKGANTVVKLIGHVSKHAFATNRALISALKSAV